MLKLSLAILTIGFALAQDQLRQEKFEFTNPVDFVYRRHYIESLSTANKLSDYGTPSGSKITVTQDNINISADFTLNCNYKLQNDVSLQVSSCAYSDAAKSSVLAQSVKSSNEQVQAQTANVYGASYSYKGMSLIALIFSNGYADSRSYLIGSSI